jgi:hypothetical protein
MLKFLFKNGQRGGREDYLPRSDWSGSSGKLNYSAFVFLDVDRDGRYGIADRSLGGVLVSLSEGGRIIATARSNANGFANFVSSTKKKSASIRAPGIYRFAASVPPGWRTTTENAVQEQTVFLSSGSISGLAAESMLQPIGLAPERNLRATVAQGEKAEITALADGRSVDRTSVNEGRFSYSIPESADQVRVTTSSVDYCFAVCGYPIDAGLLTPGRDAPSAGKTMEAIDFESVTTRGLRKVPCGYGSLDWSNFNAMARDFTPGSQGYQNGATSGDYIAYTSSGHPAEISSDQPFDFLSVAMSAAWRDAEGEVAEVTAWRGKSLISRDKITLSYLVPVIYTPRLGGVTSVKFTTEHYWQLVIDDLKIAR